MFDDPLAIWRSRESFTLSEAAHLVCGIPPTRRWPQLVSAWEHVPLEWRDALGLVNQVYRELQDAAKTLEVGVVPTRVGQPPRYGNVQREKLVEWLESKELQPAFFFPEGAAVDIAATAAEWPVDQFRKELRAAVDAFLAVSGNPVALVAKTPKQALTAWLDENANRLGLSQKAKERIATVANWSPQGGAPETPTGRT